VGTVLRRLIVLARARGFWEAEENLDMKQLSTRNSYCSMGYQMRALDRDYIEYVMGHTISIYHDIQMKGKEVLRGIYLSSGLSIRPKTCISKIDALKEIIRAWDLNPDEILTRDAMMQPHRTMIDQNRWNKGNWLN
jgi:hypothetical protein